MSTMLPKIEMDSTAVDWKEFMVIWARYEEKLNLAGPGLLRQVITCLQFIDSLSHPGLEVDILSDQQEGIPEGKVSPNTAAKDEVASEIADTTDHIQPQVRSRPGKKSRQKSRKKNLIVREKDERLHTTTTFMAENKSYQSDDFQFNSLKFGEIVALMYSARKVSREMQTINKVKIPHMLLEDMKWTVR